MNLISLYEPLYLRLSHKLIVQGKKLERSDKNRIISGVIGGLGEYLSIDPNILRIVAVVLLILFPILMVILYVVGVFLIPRSGEAQPLISSFKPSEHMPLIVGIVLILVGAAMLTPTSVVTYPVFGLHVLGMYMLSVAAGIVLIILGLIISLPQLKKL